MDPLSGTASLIAVIQLTQVIAIALKGYFSSAREARKDIDRLFSSITSLEIILVEAAQVAKNEHSEDLATSLQVPDGPLQLLKAELERLSVVLKAPRAPRKGRLGSLVNSLRWPFKKGEMERSMIVIERHKSTLNANLGFGMLDLQFKDLDTSRVSKPMSRLLKAIANVKPSFNGCQSRFQTYRKSTMQQ